MNVTFAQTFLEVVKTGNLNRAAARLHVTESTVTTRINALENLLGQKLLVRSRTGAALTSAGFKFLRYAETMTQAWGQARQELSLSDEFNSLCNIGCEHDLWDQVGGAWADQLRENHPDVAQSFWAGSVDDLERWLSSGLVDVALMYDAAVLGSWQVTPLFTDRLIQVSTVPRSQIDWDPGYIYVDLGPEFRKQHAEAFQEARTPIVTISSSAWAIDYLMRWGGSAYLPARMVQSLLEQERLFVVEGAPEFSRSAYLVSRPDAALGWDWFEGSVAALKEQLS